MKRDLIEKAIRLVRMFESGDHWCRASIGAELNITPQAAGRWIEDATFAMPITEYQVSGHRGRPITFYYLIKNED